MQFVALCLAVLDFLKSFNFSGWGERGFCLFYVSGGQCAAGARSCVFGVLRLMGESVPDGILWA